MKKQYEKPVILKLKTGFMNKFGENPYYARKIRTHIDDVSIEDLVASYGSPLFVFSESAVRKKYQEIYNSFSTRYPNITFGWSYKTNYLQAICAIMRQEGAIAEVVSEMEYDKARKLGVEGEDIIFNGPHKTLAALEKAVTENARIHVDHLEEVMDLESVADKLGRKIDVGIRLNIDTGIRPQWWRFGFNLDSGQAFDAIKRIKNADKLRVNGLHCHIGTFILDPNAYAVQVEKMIKLAYQVEDTLGFKIEYIDIGGGFPSRIKLKGSYLPPDVSIPSMDEYAEKITTAFHSSLRPGDFPKLILESGRAIIDEAGYLISSIFAAKRLPDGRKAYIADAGINNLFTSFWYKFDLEIGQEVQGLNEPSIIYGPLCMNIDVIDEGTLLPALDRGTRLIFSPVGAYNVTQWMQFIEHRPAVVMIGLDGKVDLIREAEDLSDIDRRERLPDRLR